MNIKITTKKLSLIIRLSTIITSIYSFYESVLGFFGEYDTSESFLFGSTTIFGLVIFLLIREQGKYHCIWMQILSLWIIATSLFNYIDHKTSIFDDYTLSLVVIIIMWSFTLFSLLFLAFKHFYYAIKRNRKSKV